MTDYAVDIRAKIRGLLALSASSNEHEAASAAQLAARLMDRHRVSHADLEPTLDALAIFLSAYEPWASVLFAAVGYRCAVLPLQVVSRFYYVGYPVDIQGAAFLFLQTHALVFKMTHRAWRAHEIELTDPVLGRYPSLDEPGAEEEWRASFAFGCALAIHEGLRADLHSLEDQGDEQDMADGTALVPLRVAVPDEARRYAEQRFGRLQQGGCEDGGATLLPGAVQEGQRAWPRR